MQCFDGIMYNTCSRYKDGRVYSSGYMIPFFYEINERVVMPLGRQDASTGRGRSVCGKKLF